jgi:O-acetyl-ADP-ribose deacetylase (regulator of RNase III)
VNLNEAIRHAEMLAPKNKGAQPGKPGFSNLIYYVCPWNDGYSVCSDSHIKRHPDIKWVYNTRDKQIMSWKLKYTKGDLVRDAERDFDVIGHGCNCYCTMGAGIALGVKRKWPRAYDADRGTAYGDSDKLGTYSSWTTGGLTILNMYTQWHYKGSNVKADYDAIRSCMRLMKQEFSGKRMGLPLIGAGLAGGDWSTISKIIEEELQGENVTIVIWENSQEDWQLKLISDSQKIWSNIAILETWTESESGWGQRPDGVSLHLTEDDYKEYVKNFWEGKSGPAPHEYSREDGNTKVVYVNDDIYNEIKGTKNGLRLWQNPSVLESEGKVKFII